MNILSWLYSCVFLLCQLFIHGSSKAVDKDNSPDALLSMSALLTKYNYNHTILYITTDDGYILKCYRVQKCPSNKIPMVLVHGIIVSSMDWIMLGPGQALGYMLFDECYDTWMCNTRGNFESRNHTTLDPDKPEFWNFSTDELGRYDLPAIINRVLKDTGKDRIYYIAHSQGTTAFFIYSSLFPEKSKKVIKEMHALAPVAFMSHIKNPIFAYLSTIVYMLEPLAYGLGFYELTPRSWTTSRLGMFICSSDFVILSSLCSRFTFTLAGTDPYLFNKTVDTMAIANHPAGSSVKTLAHYGQLVDSGKFRQYDYRILGFNGNMMHYGKNDPPDYPIHRIRVPMFFYYSLNDQFTSPIDIKHLASLVHKAELYQVPFDNFNHLDFNYANHAKELVFDRLMENLNKQTA